MPESSATKTLYVSPTGSDSNAGTLVAPYHTLGKALLAASSGTVVLLRGGSYGTTQITGRRFDPADPVTVRSYPGERAVFVGQSIYTNAFYLGDCQGIRLRDLTFDAPYDTNIKFDTSQHIELDRSIVRNAGRSGSNGFGLIVVSNSGATYTYSADVQVWNSTFYNNGVHGGAGYDHQIYLGSSGDLKGTSVEAGLRGGVIANNIIYDGPVGFDLQLGDSARNVIVANNTFVHASDPVSPAGTSIVVWDGQTNTWGTRDCLIVNNVFTNNVHSAVVAVLSQNATSNVVRNNLAFANGSADYVPNYGTKVGFTLGTNLASANPLYVNYAGKNFHLQAGSPALGKSDPAYTPPTDITGAPRPSTPALGAYG